MSTSRTIAIAVSLAAIALAAPAQAQEGVAAWRVECTGDGKTLDCRAVQALFHRESRQLLISVLVRRPADSKLAQMTVQLPLGLNLTEPVHIKVDNGPQESQQIQTCTNVGCFLSMSLNDKQVALMRNGNELKVTIQDASKKPVELSLPLLGFSVAYDKVR
jgi:invasion protein IalB